MLEDSEIVFDYMTNELKISPKKIILVGRSMGTGPGTHLASVREPAALILISPYTTLKDVIIHKVGKIGNYIFKEKFYSIEKIKNVKCPILFVHGQRDTLIPYSHSEKLKAQCSTETHTAYPKQMAHKSLDIENHVVPHMKEFFDKIKLTLATNEGSVLTSKDDESGFRLPESLTVSPVYVTKNIERKLHRRVLDKVWSFIQNNNPHMD